MPPAREKGKTGLGLPSKRERKGKAEYTGRSRPAAQKGKIGLGLPPTREKGKTGLGLPPTREKGKIGLGSLSKRERKGEAEHTGRSRLAAQKGKERRSVIEDLGQPHRVEIEGREF